MLEPFKLVSDFREGKCTVFRFCMFGTLLKDWWAKGRHVCRHGVFFRAPLGSPCSCMRGGSAEMHVWTRATFMPALDSTLKTLVAVPFDASRFQRLARLQAEVRRLGW